MPRKPSSRPTNPLFTPSQRRDELRVLLRSGWQPIAAIMERLDVSRSTAQRRLRELGATDPLECQEADGAPSLWRLPPSAREHALYITTAEMVSLGFVRNAFGFLTGTGIKEDLDSLCARFSHALKSSDYAHWKTLDRKLYDVNEGVHRYHGDGDDTGKLDVVNDVITGLLREERLSFKLRDGRTVAIDPYTLVLYKKGLYVLGFSHAHGEVRLFGLDKIDDAERAGEEFAYPPEFDAHEHMSGPFGIIRGDAERVVVRFDASVSHYVTRRTWHATQAFRAVDGGIEMTLEPAGTSEMVSWVLSFGGKAEVIAPQGLRERVAKEAREAVARYGSG
jgi:predicted DNA-binding transcriptional regulator YafY